MHSTSISNRATKRQALFMELYKSAFPAVAKYVSRMGGSFDEAKDVFQDALVAYYEKTVAQPSPLDNDTAYVIGIAKYLWLKRYRQSSANVPLTDLNIAPDAPEESPSGKRLLRFLSAAGQKCMDLLQSFYYHQLPLTEIAAIYGYAGVRSATVQKYKCLEKVRATIKEKALAYDDFME